MTVHYNRWDGAQISLPCVDVFRLQGGLVHDYHIYMDIAPLFA